jgi:hypothetical protein
MRELDAVNALEGALQALAENVAADESFAHELYASLCNMRWERNDMRAPVSISWRCAGGIVADLAGRGGCYLDYYCSGNEGEVSERVRAALAALGWSPVPWPD